MQTGASRLLSPSIFRSGKGRPCGSASQVWTMAVHCGRESTTSVSSRLADRTLRRMHRAGDEVLTARHRRAPPERSGAMGPPRATAMGGPAGRSPPVEQIDSAAEPPALLSDSLLVEGAMPLDVGNRARSSQLAAGAPTSDFFTARSR